MNHKRWQVSVMVAFAWVLWSRSYSEKKPIFEVIEGYDSRRECDSHRKEIISAFKKPSKNAPDNEITETLDGRFILRHSGGGATTFLCLPATNTDPRPRSK
jgi:hypothetical protein